MDQQNLKSKILNLRKQTKLLKTFVQKVRNFQRGKITESEHEQADEMLIHDLENLDHA